MTLARQIYQRLCSARKIRDKAEIIIREAKKAACLSHFPWRGPLSHGVTFSGDS